MRIEPDIKLDFDSVLIKPKRSSTPSRLNVNITRDYKTLHSKKEFVVTPIIASNMTTIGCEGVAKVMHQNNMMTALHKFFGKEKLIELFNSPISSSLFYTIGMTNDDVEKLTYVSQYAPIKQIMIDVANGYSEVFVKHVQNIRNKFPEAIICAGNVCTPEATQELLMVGGADIVKIGIGPGSACETRKITSIGYPQLSATIECADAAHGLNGHIIADGGCKEISDIIKAMGAGADFVMLGGMIAGHEECEGTWFYETELDHKLSGPNGPVYKDTKTKLKFYGMSSEFAMEKYNGGMADYKASEGKVIWVDYKGPLDKTLKNICGGIRSACSYVGATRLRDFSKCTTFIRIK